MKSNFIWFRDAHPYGLAAHPSASDSAIGWHCAL